MITSWLVVTTAGCCTPAHRPSELEGDAPSHERPSVVLILADDQGWTGTSVQMDPDRADSRSDFYETPNLKRLALRGMRFSQAYAPAPNCSPTRASIQTGKSPAQLHMTDIIGVSEESPRYKAFYADHPLMPPIPRGGLPHDEITIAEYINETLPEYVTAHFGKWHLGSGGPGEHGYEFHDQGRAWEGPNMAGENPKDIFGITADAVAFLEDRAAQNEPFFLQISHFAVHLPVRARDSTIRRYRRKERGERHDHPRHAAMTENLDTGIGIVLDTIEELGLDDNTYIFYFSDNGAYTHNGMTNNLPLRHGKASVWEGGIRVPLMVRGPGIETHSYCTAPVHGVDFFGTVRDLLSIDAPLPAGIEGASFAHLLRNPDDVRAVDRPRDEFIWYFPHYQDDKGVTPQAAIRVGDFKLVHIFETGDHHLFDLAADPEEQNDLSDDLPNQCARLFDRLQTYLTEIGADRPMPNPRYGEPKPIDTATE